MTSLRSVLLVCLAFAATPALAQIRSEAPLTETNGRLVLDALDHHLAMPLPDWVGSRENVVAEVETTFLAEDDQALLEIYPKGESEALWTILYGARISRDEEERTLADYRAALMILHANSCDPALTGFFQLGADDGDNLAPLGFVCGAYLPQYSAFAGLGEVMVASFRRSDTGVAIIYQEWRGKAFDPRDPQSWPVATDVVEARAAELQADAALSKAD
ncbi:hypothetical protein DMC47_01535 [Nostoc sp. 3335mG]|nr:hypothetical protein DMC47_01535 [Nostoc sp. 3335mG]